jgi:hypothetical protein
VKKLGILRVTKQGLGHLTFFVASLPAGNSRGCPHQYIRTEIFPVGCLFVTLRPNTAPRNRPKQKNKILLCLSVRPIPSPHPTSRAYPPGLKAAWLLVRPPPSPARAHWATARPRSMCCSPMWQSPTSLAPLLFVRRPSSLGAPLTPPWLLRHMCRDASGLP